MPWNSSIATLKTFAPPPEVISWFGSITESGIELDPYNPSVDFRVLTNGYIETNVSTTSGFVTDSTWARWSNKAPLATSAALYEIMWSFVSGDPAHPVAGGTGPIDTWLDMSTAPNIRWTGGVATDQTDTCVYSVTVRRISDMVQQFQQNVTINLEQIGR